MCKRKMLVGILVAFFLAFLGAAMAGAQGASPVGFVKEKGQVRWIMPDAGVDDLSGLTPADIEKISAGSEAAPIVHQVPQYPIIVDGVRYAPEQISLFDGQVLRFIWDERTEQEQVLYAFTTLEGLETYLQVQWGWSPSQNSATEGQTAVYYSYFYEHTYYRGACLGLVRGYGIRDLRPWNMNDKVSSVAVAPDASWATLYEHINYGGSQLWMRGGYRFSSLVPYGWNDRASSVVAWRP